MAKKISGTALVVDDEESIRLTLAMHCEDLGLTAVEAGDGEEALGIVESQEINLIISDLKMPKLDGIKFLEKLRENNDQTPFIIVTGYSSKEATVEALRLGAFDFIEKPFKAAHVLEVIRRVFEIRERELQSAVQNK